MTAQIQSPRRVPRLHRTGVALWSSRAGDMLVLLCVLLLVWQVVYGVVGAVALSPPIGTAVNAWDLLTSADFWPNVYTTFRAMAIALVVEVAAGLVLGVLFGLNRLLGEVMEPLIITFYSIPKIVFYPIVLMFCGIGLLSVVVFAVMHGILPIILFTMTAVRNIRPAYVKSARVMRLRFVQVLWFIALPAAIPEVFTGLRIGFAATMLGVLLSEMFGSKNGLGFMLMNAIGLNQVSLIMALALLLAAFAASVNLGLLALDRRLHRRV